MNINEYIDYPDEIINNFYSNIKKPGLNILFDMNNLYNSFIKCSKEAIWKESVQRFQINLQSELVSIQKDIMNGEYKFKECNKFILSERGHTRYIKAHCIRDRVVLACFTDYILIPRIVPKLIYDNGASMKSKGTGFTRRRFSRALNKYYIEHGNSNKGYIRIYDFKKYFDNIKHSVALYLFHPFLNNDEYEFLELIFKHFEIDLSFLSDEEFDETYNGIYNAIDYALVSESLLTGEKMMKKSIGIGSTVSQITGLLVPSPIDNYAKIVCGITFYGRFMDDFYIISETIDKLNFYDKGIKEICDKLSLNLNIDKVRTYPLSSEFVYLKIKYSLLDNGMILKKIPTETFRLEKHKLQRYKKALLEKRININDVIMAYKTWRYSYIKYDSSSKLHELDLYFMELFDISDYNLLKHGTKITNEFIDSYISILTENIIR